MNNLDVILESIIGEGNRESQEILDKANAEASEIIAERTEAARKEANDIISSAQTESNTIRTNEAVSSQRQSRDIEITAKNELIDEVVDELINNLKNIDNESYKNFVKNTISKADIKNGELILSENHKNTIADGEISGLSIARETVEDGFVVRSGKIEYDNRFSSIIKYNIDDIRKQISDELFN